MVLVAGDKVRVSRINKSGRFIATKLKANEWEMTGNLTPDGRRFIEFNGYIYAFHDHGTSHWKSSDGETWSSVTTDYSIGGTTPIFTVHGTRLFLGDGRYIYYSDNGTNWTLSKDCGASHFVYSLCSFGTEIYAFVNDGVNKWCEIYSSTDGTAWSSKLVTSGNVYINSSKSFNSVLYACGYDSVAPYHPVIYYSSDGTTWTSVDLADVGYFAFEMFETNNIIYIVAGGTNPKIYSFIGGVAALVYTLTGKYPYSLYYNQNQILDANNFVYMAVYNTSTSLHEIISCYRDPTNWGVSQVFTSATAIQGLGELSNGKIFASCGYIYRKYL